MAYAVIHHFPGGTQTQYEAVIAAVHPAGGLPDGQTHHAAGPSAGGWTIIARHESAASWEKFRDETLLPAMDAGIEGGFTVAPVETAFEVVAETLTSPAEV
jgi:hypothetical protein